MCGRFTLAVDPADLQAAFGLAEPPPAELTPRYNIAPTQPVAVIPNEAPRRLDFFTWGLIPSWAKDPKIGNSLINARGETVASKPSFRAAFKRRRCLIPATGFYEWKKGGQAKTPMLIQRGDGQPFAFAGLWELWNSPDGSTIKSCTIITTTPNRLIKAIHDRMPVILPPEAYDAWLAPDDMPAQDAARFVRPFDAAQLKAFAVSTLVNSPRNESPECIQPVE